MTVDTRRPKTILIIMDIQDHDQNRDQDQDHETHIEVLIGGSLQLPVNMTLEGKMSDMPDKRKKMSIVEGIDCEMLTIDMILLEMIGQAIKQTTEV